MSRRIAVQIVFAVLVTFMGVETGRGQATPEKSPEFEVASIKPTKPGAQGFFIRMQPGGRFTATGITTKFLLEQAYDIKDSQILGAPTWFDSDRFDIDAKPDEATGAAFDKLPPDQRRPLVNSMLKALLADRFKLAVTHETKELPVYALVVAKGGPKFHESTYKPPEKLPDTPPPPPGRGGPPRQGIMMNGRGELTVTYIGLPMFADVLSRVVSRIVVDKTGLTGKYDFTLKYTPDEAQGPMMPGSPKPGGDSAPPPDSTGPSIFTALQEQLGLKLESQKAPTDVVLIQHVEKPSEN
jgi:bla regulator protein BlaR1